jgi:hypothetical protein
LVITSAFNSLFITSDRMTLVIEIKVSDDVLLTAREQAVEMGNLHNSITRGQGNIAGFIGELIVANLLNATQQNTYDYDLVLPNSKTVDVKTKRTSVTPLPHYECSVAKLSGHQTCDYFAFTRVKNDYSVAWFLGMLPRDVFYKESKFLKKGTVDPDNGYVVKSTCYNIAIDKLWELYCEAEFAR